MSIELVYRMRTCAAALAMEGAPPLALLRDAADLLAEVSNMLDVPEPLGEPMSPLPAAPPILAPPTAEAMAMPCPNCGSIDIRTVRRSGNRLLLTCPKCAHQFPFKPTARWQ